MSKTPITLLFVATLLSACGGGSQYGNNIAEVSLAAESVKQEPVPSDAVVQPTFHVAPVVLQEPTDVDTSEPTTSASLRPATSFVSAAQSRISSSRLTVQQLATSKTASSDASGRVSTMAAGSVVRTYTPAQIRAAYGLPTLPSPGVTPTLAQAASMGAGQTIYIVNAMHNPNVVAELNAFNTKFGLPGCTVQAIAPTTALPLAPANKSSGCVLSVVYSSPSGTMTSAAPPYDAGWATEIALDVQWAHAIAPMARIVLIEASDASISSMSNAIKLANLMGPGVVSMSFGANEGSWSASLESVFSASNMTYFAATGDWGTQVLWPSVSSRVVAVGGTSLDYSGTGSRTEVGWSKTGGGISLYAAAPNYQTSNNVPGFIRQARRAVADVGFNADPATGQYVAVIPQGSSTVSWISAGGTSLSTPQWAGIAAIANAQRVSANKPVLGLPHTLIYNQIGSVTGIYTNAFYDVKTGSNGSCVICTAKTGYDGLTGLGTPNVTQMLAALNATIIPPPLVSANTLSYTAGSPITFKVNTTSVNPLSFSLTGAPAGMSISSVGLLTWPAPKVGTFSVTVVAKDTVTGLAGVGVQTLTVKAPTAAPVVTAKTINGIAGSALSFTPTVTTTNPITYSLSTAPTGMTISSTGVVTWPRPTVGTYRVSVVVTDKVTGLSGRGLYTVIIAAASTPPIITAAAITTKAGTVLTGSFSVVDPSGLPVSVTISGVPGGMFFSALSPTSIGIKWNKPVTGTYTLSITAVNTRGLRSTAALPITVTR